MGTTTIEVTDEQADRLYEMTSRGERYRDVIDRLLAAWDGADVEDVAGGGDRPDRDDDQEGGADDLANAAENAVDRVRQQVEDADE